MNRADTLFDELLSIRAYRPSAKLTALEQFFQRLSRRSLIVALGLLGLALLMAACKVLWPMLSGWFTTAAALVLLVDVLAWYAMLLSDAVATLIQVMYRRVRNHHDRASFDHDTELADRIGSYLEVDVAQVDAWYEERAHGMERRVSMVFGREVAILGLLITVLSGKTQEASNIIINFLAPSFRTTPTHVVEAMMAALILLIVGAFGVKSQVARCAYIRYLIRLSAFRRTQEAGVATRDHPQTSCGELAIPTTLTATFASS
jgi:membrane protein implicated in regulation of membrane protease activity